MNKFYLGDNLTILREHVPDESVDLIYLDPPFNSNATYNVLFKEPSGEASQAQITAFEDTWHWGLESERAYREVVTEGPRDLANLLQALRAFLGQNDMMAYLTMMSIRLVELHRVLKPTGSLYLHCDPTASHYIKLLLDAVFGAERFRREIVWRSGWVSGFKSRASNWIRNHDTILYYTRGARFVFNKEAAYQPHPEGYQRRGGGANPRGVALDDVWTDVYSPWIMSFSREKLGYPTQKPEALLERIIQVSSNEGDVVLDPFCGCGTAVAVAERLNRRWIGIDITHLAIALMKHRLHDAFSEELSPYEVLGAPTTVEDARALLDEKDGRFQFEWWALGLIDARPAHDKKKGADTGIDGYINFFDDGSGKAKTIIVQVKSGNVTASQIRDLKGVLEREKAPIGAFITLEAPTKPMVKEAAAAGLYEPPSLPGKRYPRIQILTIEDLLAGHARLEFPRLAEATFQRAKRASKDRPVEQGQLGM
ncbi:DNA methylase [Limnochorda pilosa]|uniref:Methyltransferase n=1 Tax=Limnochorda pilosa TaxID=1555112 RepID=A0A0K2SQS3_LIMPI|nr:DNA methylase [Limnochorda pilosa]